jgi:hypothetical protein
MENTGLDSRLDIAILAQGLERAGWDVIASPETGEVAARLEHPPMSGVWTLAIDPVSYTHLTLPTTPYV